MIDPWDLHKDRSMRIARPGDVKTEWPYAWTQLLRDDPRIVTNTLLVGLLYATWGDGRQLDWPVWPSHTTIAECAGLSRPTVCRHATKLRRLGYLTYADRHAYAARGLSFGASDARVKAYLLTRP
jgi:hypothetical protein